MKGEIEQRGSYLNASRRETRKDAKFEELTAPLRTI
jgi:hypothetical protein